MSNSITVRFNEEDITLLEKKLTETNMSKSDYIRAACFQDKIIILDPEHKLYTTLVELINNIKLLKDSGIRSSNLKKGVKEICMLLQNLLTEVNRASGK